ncbi:ROK family protein [Actinomadura luteofluorescens]|uniref:ROK family protein n=1 Tax=Actinomadura luteofluorescens TaxID=46163 RepID=UPI00363FA135
MALPGIVEEAAGRVVLSANLGWRDLDLAARLAERTDLPVAIGHDVRAAVWPSRSWAPGGSAATCCSCRSGRGSRER